MASSSAAGSSVGSKPAIGVMVATLMCLSYLRHQLGIGLFNVRCLVAARGHTRLPFVPALGP